MEIPKPNSTWIIRHKDTKEQWYASSGKSSWKKINHAKSAWRASDHNCTEGIKLERVKSLYTTLRQEYPKFNEQDVYECVELQHESEVRLQEAVELIKLCSLALSEGGSFTQDAIKLLYSKISTFIKENEIENK